MILTHSINQGIVPALNRGLKMAQGKYIARMDADDVSLPERFERQVEFLEAHPEVGILGSDVIYMDSQGQNIIRMAHPYDELSIRWMSLLANVFFHPTVMIRRAVLTEYHLEYQSGIQSAQDYDLWVRLLEHTQGANLDRALLWYRVYTESFSNQHKQERTARSAQTSFAYIQRMFPEIRFPPDEHDMLVAAVKGEMIPSQYRLRPALARRYMELWRAFVVRHNGEPALKRLRHAAVLQAAKIGLYPAFQPGWMETLRGLFAADPLWVFYFAINFPHMVYLNLHGRRLRQLRTGSKEQRG